MSVFVFAAGQVMAEVKLHALFSDNAVLQQGQPVPVWGTAKDGEKVTVEFAPRPGSGQAGQKKTATAGKDGRWMVKLDPMPANATPQTLTVTSSIGNLKSEIKNILIGEVWLCGGQSNMQLGLGQTADAEKHIAAAGDPLLRLITIPRGGKAEPQQDVEAAWTVCTSSNAGGFSAVGYFFGRDLRKARGVPVGLISSNVGGTPAEKWTSREALAAEPSLKPMIDAQADAARSYPAALEKFKKDEPELMKKWETDLAKAKAEGKTLSKKRKPVPPGDPAANGVCSLYNAMIAPLQPFAMAGAIWYQGESNAKAARQYQTLFPAMIKCWRDGWNMPEMPFLFVQIAPYNGQPPEIREAQLLSWKKVPHTSMVVITDYGEAGNIHPRQKEPVGARIALAARAIAYGEKIEYSGPVYESFKVEGNKAIISFSHVGEGLVAKGGPLKGFTISGGGANFVPATATIEGDKVVVTGANVEKPVAVRYGWANVPDVNLFNKADLPASPFRTDNQVENKVMEIKHK